MPGFANWSNNIASFLEQRQPAAGQICPVQTTKGHLASLILQRSLLQWISALHVRTPGLGPACSILDSSNLKFLTCHRALPCRRILNYETIVLALACAAHAWSTSSIHHNIGHKMQREFVPLPSHLAGCSDLLHQLYREPSWAATFSADSVGSITCATSNCCVYVYITAYVASMYISIQSRLADAMQVSIQKNK